jgi:hypothetical protein
MSMSKINYKARCVVSHRADLFSEGKEYEVIDEGDSCTGGWLSVIDNTGESRSVVWKGVLWTFERVDAPQPTTIEQLLAKANRHAAKAAKHERKAAEHEAKRVEAVENARQLMPGYTIEISAKWERDLPEEQPEDMSDPSNWKAGDVVECVSDRAGMGITKGNRYTLRAECEDFRPGIMRAKLAADDDGELNGHQARMFRWISRPQGESA